MEHIGLKFEVDEANSKWMNLFKISLNAFRVDLLVRPMIVDLKTGFHSLIRRADNLIVLSTVVVYRIALIRAQSSLKKCLIFP